MPTPKCTCPHCKRVQPIVNAFMDAMKSEGETIALILSFDSNQEGDCHKYTNDDVTKSDYQLTVGSFLLNEIEQNQ